jgi:heavy metal sensor kinase
MTPVTLRTRLTLSYAAVLVLFLAALAVAYYHLFARQLDVDATTDLSELTRGVHGYLRFQEGTPSLEYDHDDPEQAAFVQEATHFYQVYEAGTGRLLTQSEAIEPLGLHYTPAEVRAFVAHPTTFDIQTDRRRIRFSNSVIAPATGEVYLVQVGVPLDARDAALRRLVALLTWSLPVGLVAVLGIGRWMAGRALAPIAAFAATARTIGIDDLHRRMPVRGAGDELDAVADAFNDVVARLQRAVAEMRQFSAAMAHEIRTPLAAIRAGMELSLTVRRSREEHRQAIASQLDEVDRLTRLLAHLLTLARAEAGEISIAHNRVELAALARFVVDTVEPVAQAKGIALTCECTDDVEIMGDRGWMERLLLNLVDNAIKFTNPGGLIIVDVARTGNTASLAVHDSGIGIAADALPNVFDRFYRADVSRSPATDGAGLGLTLVKWIADRHGAAIDVASRPGYGSTFTVKLPSAAPSCASRLIQPAGIAAPTASHDPAGPCCRRAGASSPSEGGTEAGYQPRGDCPLDPNSRGLRSRYPTAGC